MTQTGRMTDLVVVDNPELSRVEARLGDAVAGFAAYVDRPGQRVFTHTEVDPAYEGQGIGGRLARAALDQARADGLRVVPRCPFIHAWIDKHPDYADLVDPD
jgi:predicted GNAT family acetyltransferase